MLGNKPVVALLSLVLAVPFTAPRLLEADEIGSLGQTIAEFSLPDFRGKTHQLSDFDDREFLVVFFTGTECPLSKLYGVRMQRLQDEYADRGLTVIGVCSNAQDSLSDLERYAGKHQLRYPLLKDSRNQVADLFRATRTPQVFLLDRKRTVRYEGRIDGQFTFGSGVGLAKPAPKREDLRMAVDELLSGKEVSVASTEAKGCLIGRQKEPDPQADVTFSNQISRLFQKRCVECHREGQIAPFALTDYEEAAGWGEMIAEVVHEERMPPWHADPNHGNFSNENRLTAEEKQLIASWVEKGCPPGDPNELPPPRSFREGWFMQQEPDLILHMSDERVDIKAAGVERYRYYEVDPGFTEDRWVTIAECMPENRAVVHHIIVYIASPHVRSSNIGRHELLVGFAPGTRPFVAPPGWARRIPAGAKLIFEMHYTPIGTPQTDRSSVGLVFAEPESVTHQMWTTNAINTRFVIPPHAADHTVHAQKQFQEDVELLSLFPHMHMRGKSFQYDLEYPDGSVETLLRVPRYDFNWQTSFVLETPKLIPAGSELRCTAVFDNSAENPANPDPEQTVRWGEQTWEEMMIGWHDVAVPIHAAKSD